MPEAREQVPLIDRDRNAGRALEPQPVLTRRHLRRPSAYTMLALAVLISLVTVVLAIRLGFRLADAGPDSSAFSARDPILLIALGAAALALFRAAERLGDF